MVSGREIYGSAYLYQEIRRLNQWINLMPGQNKKIIGFILVLCLGIGIFLLSRYVQPPEYRLPDDPQAVESLELVKNHRSRKGTRLPKRFSCWWMVWRPRVFPSEKETGRWPLRAKINMWCERLFERRGLRNGSRGNMPGEWISKKNRFE